MSQDSFLNNSEPIDHTDSRYTQFLQDLQGNILNGHGRDYSVHIFLRFPRPEPDKPETAGVSQRVRDWIVRFAKERVTSAKAQFDGANKFRDSLETIEKERNSGIPEEELSPLHDGGLFAHIAFAARALTEEGGLGLGKVPTPAVPPGNGGGAIRPGDPNYLDVFREGLKARADILFDPSAAEWEEGFRENADALIILGDDKPNRMIIVETQIIKELRDFNATVLTVERGHTIWKKFERKRRGEPRYGIPVEHFGYADGVSQPVFTQAQLSEYLQRNPDLENVYPSDRRLWDPSAPLSLILVPDPNGRSEHSYGSYLVFRKLEQNVHGFKQAKQEMAKKLNIAKQLAGAMAVGRFEDATALVLEPGDTSDQVTNNLNYKGDPAALACPYHAHIRKGNPRLESVKTGGPFAEEEATELGHRIARRGVPYGGVLNESENLEELPTGGLGLLFMCYQGNIQNQFEFIQRFWCNNPVFLQPALGGPGAAQYAEQREYRRYHRPASSRTLRPAHWNRARAAAELATGLGQADRQGREPGFRRVREAQGRGILLFALHELSP